MAITKVTRNMLTTGIVDNSNATAITIDSSENVNFVGDITLTKTGTDDAGIKFATANANRYIASDENGVVSIGTGTTLTGGTQYLTIDSGNVGIGTASPTAFTGYITVHHKNTAGDAIHLIESDGGIIGQTFVNDASGVVTTGARSNHPWRVTTNDTERLRVDTSGNVGIGTTAPGDKLHVRIGTNLNWHFGYPSSNTTSLVALNDAEGAYVEARIDASPLSLNSQSGGNVGIGTTSPSQKLHVVGKIKLTDDLIIGGTSPRIDYDGGSTGALRFFSTSANAERMRILSTGLIAIGTTVNTVAKTHIVESESRDCLRLTNTRNPSSSAPYVATFGFNYQPNNGTSYFLNCKDDLDGSPTARCIIQSNGGIANYQSNDSNLSDARLKTDIQDAPNALDIINNLKVRTFKYHDQTDEKIHTGLIAQETETVDLSLVNQDGWADKAPDGEEPYKSIYNTDLMFKMLKAIQELTTKLEAAEARITTLEG